MAMVDTRGRLLGRFNLIDAVIVLVLLSFLPVGYTAYRLFRAQVPELTGVEPTALPPDKQATLRIEGRNLRPYLRAYAGTTPATFLLENATRAEVKVPALGPGTYDLILYDEAREVSRRSNALTVAPVPIHKWLWVRGAFTGLSQEQALTLRRDLQAGRYQKVSWIRITGVSDPHRESPIDRAATGPGLSRVPAVLQVDCEVTPDGCRVADVTLSAGRVLPIPFTAAAPVNFRIEQADNFRTVEITIRFKGAPETVAFIKSGDLDVRGEAVTGAGRQGVLISWTATSARFRLPVVEAPGGWDYNNLSIKIGKTFSFETFRYYLEGVIVDLQTPDGIADLPK